MFEKSTQLEQRYYMVSLVRTKEQFGGRDHAFGTEFFFVFLMFSNNKMGNCNKKITLKPMTFFLLLKILYMKDGDC